MIVGMVALTIVWIVLGGDYGQVCNVMSFAMGTFTGKCTFVCLVAYGGSPVFGGGCFLALMTFFCPPKLDCG